MSEHCSIDALKVSHNLIASIEHRKHQLFLEVDEPWERTYSLSKAFVPELLPVLKNFSKHFSDTSVSVFAPDAAYSKPDGLRVIYLRLNEETSTYERFEYLIPAKNIVSALTEILQDPKLAEAAKAFIVPSVGNKDYFICTHKNRDACCGVFGNELYNSLRNDPVLEKKGLRIFRSSHIGGHRYAPTMLEASSLRCWGNLTEERARQIILRTGDVASILDHYRGCAALSSPYFQVAEKEMIRVLGWDWFASTARVFSGTASEGRCEVSVSFTTKDGVREERKVQVVDAPPVALRANCDDGKVHNFPQYAVLTAETKVFIEAGHPDTNQI